MNQKFIKSVCFMLLLFLGQPRKSNLPSVPFFLSIACLFFIKAKLAFFSALRQAKLKKKRQKKRRHKKGNIQNFMLKE